MIFKLILDQSSPRKSVIEDAVPQGGVNVTSHITGKERTELIKDHVVSQSVGRVLGLAQRQNREGRARPERGPKADNIGQLGWDI